MSVGIDGIDGSAGFSERAGTPEERLLQHRAHLDDIDTCILALLNERQREALQIRALKREAAMESSDPQREEAIIKRLAELSQNMDGPLGEPAIRTIYERIFHVSKNQ